MAAKKVKKAPVEHEISQEDLDNNPELVEDGVHVGDVIELPPLTEGVVVTWNGGTRAYTKDVHGKDFRELAQEFATKHNGTLM
jgi:hypothetical protein